MLPSYVPPERVGSQQVGPPRYFAAHFADSLRPKPYQPHPPHPRAYWADAVTQARVVTPPGNPPGGEQGVEVLAPTADQAASYIAEHHPLHADVLRLADAMGLIGSPA